MSEEDFNQNQEQEETETQKTEPKQERPQSVTINTPLDRPEMDWFLEQYMKKLGVTDRKQAAISLTNMFYDMGLDPYADLKDLQQNLKEMNSLLQGLPDTPATARVKDTLGGMYAAKAGRLALERMPKGASGEDAMQERMDKIMEKYLPMILTFKMMGTVMSGEPAQQQQQQKDNQKTELPPEVKEEMAAIRKQLETTQALLEQQTQERKRKEDHDELISTMQANINPQIDALRNQVEQLTATLTAKELETKAEPAQIQEIREIERTVKEAIEKLGQKEASKNLSLGDLDTFLGTLETLEKRLKKEPMGEFDWKSATVSTLGEIGKEAVGIFRDIKSAQPQQPQTQMQPAPTESTQQRHQVAKRQVQNYIMQKIDQGATKLNVNEPANTLGLTLQEVNSVYQELVTEGWIKPRTPQGTQQPPQMQPQQTQQPQPPTAQPNQPPEQGGTPTVPTANTNAPFEER
jgi:hypothetical protein